MTPISVFSSLSLAPVVQTSDPDASIKAEFGRLIHAAIINTCFRETLLTNPICAIENGYLGESFQFPFELKEQIKRIQAGTLEEFSTKILNVFDTPKISEMAVLQYH